MTIRIPDPKANTTTEAYLAYKAGYLEESELKPVLYEPYLHFDSWLAYWAGLTETYPTDKNGNPEMLCDEEALVAYLAGVTDTYPEEIKDPYDVRIVGYLKYLVSARWGKPEYPVNNEEFYLSTMKPPVVPSGDTPSSDIEMDNTAEAPFIDLKMYGDTTQQTYTGKNLFNYLAVSYPFDAHGLNVSIDADGYITFSGVLDKNYQSFIGPFDITSLLDDGETYTITQFSHDGLIMLDVYAYAQGTTTQTTLARTRTHDSESFVVDKTTYSNYFIRVLSWTTASWGDEPLTLTSRFQLEKGTATNFERYVGGVPAPNTNYPQAINTVTGEQTVAVQGKNLLDMSNFAKGGMEYGEWTNTGYRITNIQTPLAVEPSTTYTISVSLSEAVLGFRIGIHQLGADKSFLSDSGWQQIAENSYSFTTSNNTYYIGVVCSLSTTSTTVSTGTTENRTTFNTVDEWLRGCSVQLEQGSTATDFQPYQKTEYKINLGKNLFDKDNPNLLVAYIDGSHTTITANGKNRIIWIPCKANQTYTIQKYATDMVKEVAYTTVEPAIGVMVSGMVSWVANTSSITYTTGADAEYLVVRVYQSDKDAAYTVDQMLASVKIWEGGEDSAPIELCETGDYQDYIYKSDGDWYLHKATNKVTLDGSESGWEKLSNVYRIFGVASDVASSTSANMAICNSFIYWPNTGTISETMPDGQVGWRGDKAYINFRYDAVADTTAWKTWLASNPVMLYYALKTPSDTKITNQALISQLNAIMKDGSYEGKTYIKVTANDPNLPGLLYVEAGEYV